MFQEETGQSIFESLKQEDVFPGVLPGTWEELDGELQEQFTGFAGELNAQRLLSAMHTVVDQVPGLRDQVEAFGLNYPGKVIGLGMDKPDRPFQVNNLAVRFDDRREYSIEHEYLTRVIPVEEGVV